MSQVWQIRLADQVELDLQEIALWTVENFGSRQADEYLDTVMLAIEALCDGPAILGARERNDIGPGICVLPVSRSGRKGRHLVVFKAAHEQTIDVLRLLHERMDLAKHLPASKDKSH